MNCLSERLKYAFERLGISQTEAAKRCGITQQSLSYMINSKIKSSKLTPQIATNLNINSDWLMYGEGKFEETKFFEIPVITSGYILTKYINEDLDINEVECTVTDLDLGDLAFAYQQSHNEFLLCKPYSEFDPISDYLILNNCEVTVAKSHSPGCFTIFEWRKRVEIKI